MMQFPSKAIDDRAITPVIAVVLLLGITVTLVGVMWVAFSNITPPKERPVFIGCDVHMYGRNWSVTVVEVEPRPSTHEVSIVIVDENGNVSLKPPPLSDFPEFHDSWPNGTLNPGDYMWFSADTYPMGDTLMLINEYQTMYSRMLWG